MLLYSTRFFVRRLARFGAHALPLFASALALSACPIDDRSLSDNIGGSGRQQNAAGASAGTTGAGSPDRLPTEGGSSDGGASGQAGEGGAGDSTTATFPDGCADLDQDGTSDCTETLLKNSAFSSDVTSWTAEPDSSISWDARDLLGSSSSGAALVTSTIEVDAAGDSITAADQCIAVHANTILGVFANAYIDSGQATGRAAVSLWLFASDGCPGDGFADAYETAEQFATGKLLTLQGSKAIPDQIKSVRVRLGVVKPNAAKSFAVHFDNILIREL